MRPLDATMCAISTTDVIVVAVLQASSSISYKIRVFTLPLSQGLLSCLKQVKNANSEPSRAFSLLICACCHE